MISITSHPLLNLPIKIGEFQVKNRLVIPPLIISYFGEKSCMVSKNHVEHYGERAAAGFGLIIVETTAVSYTGRLLEKQLGIWDDSFIEGHLAISQRCHEHGALCVLQLSHGGRNVPFAINARPIGPVSEVYQGSRIVGASIAQLKKLESDFICAAIRAQKAGYDGVELQACYGHLLNQMICRTVNTRCDIYGGDDGRARFISNIIDGIRSECGKGFLIGASLGINDPTHEDGIHTGILYEKLGIDYILGNIGTGSYRDAAAPRNPAYPGIHYTLFDLKKKIKIPVIAMNNIYSATEVISAVRNNDVDLVAYLWYGLR